MKKFGVIKTKILNKLTESYANENKAEIKDILTLIKENKEFKEMYLFYEEIENKYIEDKETAKLYVEGRMWGPPSQQKVAVLPRLPKSQAAIQSSVHDLMNCQLNAGWWVPHSTY